MSSVTTAVHRKFINPFGDLYPDDQTDKEVFLQASPSDGHVLLRWMNGSDDAHRYTQILHLTGQPGKCSFYAPQVKIHSDQSLQQNVYHSLGTFTRAQRDEIIKLAGEVEFERTSTVYNCQTWMRDLFKAMVANKLLSKEKFDEYEAKVLTGA